MFSIRRSGELSVRLESPSIQLSRWQDQGNENPIPVYGDQGSIEGAVSFEPQPGPLIGRLNVHVRAFLPRLSPPLDGR